MMRSPCCNSEVSVEGQYEDYTATHWYACTACGQPCDPVEHVADAGKMVEDSK